MDNLIWLQKEELFARAVPTLEQVEVVLDIGPGIQPQQYIKPLVHICCEPFPQYVERLKTIAAQAKDRAYVIFNMTWAEAVRVLPAKSVDTVILFDVIEHVGKEEGQKLLEQTLRIARRQVVIFTTLGFVQQHHADGKDAWGLDGAAWQEHKSGWLPEEFGPGWKVMASKEFHLTDNMGDPRSKPAGALWAIFTHPQASTEPSFRSVLLHLWNAGVRNNFRPTIRVAIGFLEATHRIKRFVWPILRWFVRREP